MSKHKLPIKSALRMGLSIKTPVRFFFTVLLATFAFAMTGLALIAGFYTERSGKVQTYAQFIDEFALFAPEDELTVDELRAVAKELSRPCVAVGYRSTWLGFGGWELDYGSKYRIHATSSSDMVAYCTQEYEAHLPLLFGTFPKAKGEILVSRCFAQYFIACGELENMQELVEKEVGIYVGGTERSLTVCGIYSNDGCQVNKTYASDSDVEFSTTTRCSGRDADYAGAVFFSEGDFEELTDGKAAYGVFAGDHNSATGRRLLTFLESNEYGLQTDIFRAIEMYKNDIEGMKTTFAIAAIVLSVFSILMLYQFITISIDGKRQMIGILRALGGRSADVVKIFLIESGFLGVLAGVFAIGLTAGLIPAANMVVTALFSDVMAIMTFNPWAFLIVFVLSVGASLLSAFIPVFREAKRLPVDVIKFNAE